MNGRKAGGWQWQSRNTAKRVRIVFLFVLVIVALILSAIGGSGCSRSAKTGHSTSGGGANSPTGDTGAEQQNELAEEPDPAIMSLLMEELERQLAALPQWHNPIPQGYGRPRAVGYEADYLGVFSEDQPIFEPTADLWLIEGTIGDYDGNAEVGVPDITPIALNYLKSVEYLPLEADEARPDWNGVRTPAGDPRTPDGAENWRLAQIDGDGNGEIGISDVTPIALHFGAKLEGWRISIVTYEEGRKVTPILPEEGEIWERLAFEDKFGIPSVSLVEVENEPALTPIQTGLYEYQNKSFHQIEFEITPVLNGVSGKSWAPDPLEIYNDLSLPNPIDFPSPRAYSIAAWGFSLFLTSVSCKSGGVFSSGPIENKFFDNRRKRHFTFESCDFDPIVGTRRDEYVVYLNTTETKAIDDEVFELLNGSWSNAIEGRIDIVNIYSHLLYVEAKWPEALIGDSFWRVEYIMYLVDETEIREVAYLRGKRDSSYIYFEMPFKDRNNGSTRIFHTAMPVEIPFTYNLRFSFPSMGTSSDSYFVKYSDSEEIAALKNESKATSQGVDPVSYRVLNISPLSSGTLIQPAGFLSINLSMPKDIVLYDNPPQQLWISRKMGRRKAITLNDYDYELLEYGIIGNWTDSGYIQVSGYFANGRLMVPYYADWNWLNYSFTRLLDEGNSILFRKHFRKPSGDLDPEGEWPPVRLMLLESQPNGSWRNIYIPSQYEQIFSDAATSAELVTADGAYSVIPTPEVKSDSRARIVSLDYKYVQSDTRYIPNRIFPVVSEALPKWYRSRTESAGDQLILHSIYPYGTSIIRVIYDDSLTGEKDAIAIDYAVDQDVVSYPNLESATTLHVGNIYNGYVFPDKVSLFQVLSQGEENSMLSMDIAMPRGAIVWFWRSDGEKIVPLGWAFDGEINAEEDVPLAEGIFIEVCPIAALLAPEGEEFTIAVLE